MKGVIVERRGFLSRMAAGTVATTVLGRNVKSGATGPGDRTAVIPILDPSPAVLYESPDPANIIAYSPGLAVFPDGTFIATMDHEHTLKGEMCPDGNPMKGRIFTSSDRGKTWVQRGVMPIYHARPFVAGNSVYVLGHCHDLGILRSDDGGKTWGNVSWLSKGQIWHQAPCNVHYARGKVYLVMERVTDPDWPEWPVCLMAPVVMAADVNADLTKRDSWTFSNELVYQDVVKEYGEPGLVGVPFFNYGDTTPDIPGDHRPMAHVGWLETNVVQFTDPDHVWHDPAGRTFHLWMRAHTGSTNYAAILKAVESRNGFLTVSVERAPSGEPVVFLPCPGGHMKFHILYDAPSRLFWLLGSQSTDSMTRPDCLPDDRFNLPSNERHRLVLHFSKNCVDWCFAGRIDDTGAYGQSRHYASMAIHGDDLLVLSRSGDHRAKSAHDGNLITFHTVRDFRRLVY
jgi:hypothetical protein